MVVPLLLFLFSAGMLGVGLLRPGSVPQDFLVFAAFGLLVALVDLLRRPGARIEPVRNWLIIDGSNIMHWKDDAPQLATVQAVIAELSARGFFPGVIFDANAGYKLAGRYQGPGELARLLDLTADRVMVVPKGVQADPYLLQFARQYGVRVVSQDRFRDRAEEYPEVKSPGFLIRGGFRDGTLWLDETPLVWSMADAQPTAQAAG